MSKLTHQYLHGDSLYTITVERAGSGHAGWRATIDGVSYELEVLDSQPGQLSLFFEGLSPSAGPNPSVGPNPSAGRPLRLAWATSGNQRWVALDGCTYLLEKPITARRRKAAAAGEDTVRAPMPAQVLSVEVAEGQLVKAGQTLLLLEAMKMEIRLAAPRAGRVLRLAARTGGSVEKDQLLVEIGE